MATLTLKNIPDRLYERLKVLAKLRHRSLNSEIIYNLENAVGISASDPEQLRQSIRELRESMKFEAGPEEIARIIEEARRR